MRSWSPGARIWAGSPNATQPIGTVAPGGTALLTWTTALMRTSERAPSRAPLNTAAPVATNTQSSTVQPERCAWGPTSTWSPRFAACRAVPRTAEGHRPALGHQHRPEQHAALRADRHVAADGGGGSDVGGRVDAGTPALMFEQHECPSSLSGTMPVGLAPPSASRCHRRPSPPRGTSGTIVARSVSPPAARAAGRCGDLAEVLASPGSWNSPRYHPVIRTDRAIKQVEEGQQIGQGQVGPGFKEMFTGVGHTIVEGAKFFLPPIEALWRAHGADPQDVVSEDRTVKVFQRQLPDRPPPRFASPPSRTCGAR
jgi:hypothetical protein